MPTLCLLCCCGSADLIAKPSTSPPRRHPQYGQEPNKRYVTRGRLEKMLEREYELLVERMPKERAKQTQYFVFADTVSARSFRGAGECHGWMGVRAQLYPEAEPSQVVLHVRMIDERNKQQAEALGMLGVNLLYATFYLKREPQKLLDSLLDVVGRGRIEIDECHMSGPYFDTVDHRLTALHLITSGLTNAVMFDNKGQLVTAADHLYKKDVLVLRGRFRPVTKVAIDMSVCAERMMKGERDSDLLVLAEISTRHLATTEGTAVDHKDFLSRVDVLCAQGFSVVVSDYLRFFRLREYFSRYTRRRVGFCMSVFNVIDLFEEQYYEGMNGGILEAMGRLFSGDVRLYVYPRHNPKNKENTKELITADSILSDNSSPLSHLYAFLRIRNKLIPVTGYSPDVLNVDMQAAIQDLQRGGRAWEAMVPEHAVAMIKEKRLFGFDSQ
eukprot:TRINITY_DN301_c0_g1_i1.p1 TRINITY_DN301_c0_g1~~TRINITY_DN301_c0_g1_i1.p1  ORF type:complete len:441 (+),score=147.22 TRINITY_DN301_c0_g1_i1:357-1679(+)